tara:strand:- start:249 stop:743 length:495 start_codon:yes stop_codon:yes gene_type:complete
MIDLDLNSDDRISEGTDIPVTVTYVSMGNQTLKLKTKEGEMKEETVDCIKVTLETKNEKSLKYQIPIHKKFKGKFRDLFIAVGLSEFKDGEEVITTSEENELVGKQLLIDTVKNGMWTNVSAVRKVENKTEAAQAIKALTPLGKNAKLSPPPELGDPKESIDFG